MAGVNCYAEAVDAAFPDSPDTVVTTLKTVTVESGSVKKDVSSGGHRQTIDASRIKDAGITDISDAMRRMAGVNLRDYGGAGGMKTVSVRGFGAEHTAVVYDGVTLTDCQTGQIDLSRYSLDNVRAMTLIAGENDDIFLPAKATASASSLSITTFTAPGADTGHHFKGQMKFGSFGTYNPFLRYSYGGENLSFSTNAEYIHANNDYPFTLRNGNVETRERRENSRMNSWKGEMNMAWRIETGKTLSGKLYYYDNSRRLPGPVIYYVDESHERLRDRNFFGQLQFKGRLSRLFSLLATAKYNWAATHYTDVSGKYPGGVLDNYYLQREVYTTGSLLFIPMEGLAADYSIDWTWNNLSSNSPKGIRPYRNSILQSLAVKYSWRWMTVMARGLYSIYLNGAKDGESGKDNCRMSPAVSVSVRPWSDTGFYIRGSYKNIFRVPTFNEAYFDNYGSINLDPEITDQYNLGLTFQEDVASWLPELTVTADGYVNEVRNKIVALPYNLFVWTMSNLGRVRIFGADICVDATFRLTPHHSLLLSGSYSYQRARIITDRGQYDWNRQLAYTPLNSGSVSLTWLNPWVNIAVHTVGCGPRYATNTNLPESRIKGYADTGVTLSRKIAWSRYSAECRFDLVNIFDEQYEIVRRYPMPGRSWKLTLEFEI